MFIWVVTLARPEAEPKTPLAQRLRRIRREAGDPERDDFAKTLGIHKNTLAYYERGDRTPDAEVLRNYRDQCQIDINWLVTGEGEMFETRARDPQARSVGHPTDLDHQGMIRLPVYSDVRASAGPGAAALSEQVGGVISFDPRFLRDQGAVPEKCSVIWAHGDSMTPTIPDGSALIVDRSQTEVKNGSIMVIGVGDDLLVKRVRRRLDGLIDLISDNSAYAPETLGPASLQQLRIVGRVVYFCRTP